MALSGTDFIAIRCIENTLSVAIAGQDHPITAGDISHIKFRADAKEIIEVQGNAINATIIQLDDSEKLIEQLNGAKSVAIRVAGPNQSYAFTIQMKQSDKAIALVKKACGK